MRRWRIGLILAMVAILGYGSYVAVRQHRAKSLHLNYEEALQRRDFVKAHAVMLDYLRLCPGDVGTHLLAAQAARQAQLGEPYSGSSTDLLHQAARHLDDCAKLNGPEESIALERVLLRVQQGEIEGSEEALLTYLQTGNPDAPLVLEGLIHGYLRRSKLDKAGIAIGELLTLQPENVQALVWRGRIKEQVFANLPSAREDYEEAIRLNPDFDSARHYLVQNLMGTNHVDEADKHLAVLEKRLPQDPMVRLARALCRIAQGQNDSGRALLDDWLLKTPPTHAGRPLALTALAKLYLTLDQPAQAEHYARQALRISPLDRNALYTLFRSLIAQGHEQEAQKIQTQLERINKDMQLVSEASTLIAESPNDLKLRHRLGEAYLRLGREGEALVWFTSVLDRDPVYGPTLQALADYYDRAGDARQAAEFRQRLAPTGKSPANERLDTDSGRSGP